MPSKIQYMVLITALATLQTTAAQCDPGSESPKVQLQQVVVGKTIEYSYSPTSENIVWCKDGRNLLYYEISSNESRHTITSDLTACPTSFNLYLADENIKNCSFYPNNNQHMIHLPHENITATIIQVQVVEAIPCSEPPQPRNGNVNTEYNNKITTANFSCDPGFYLKGNKTLTCERASNEIQGHWNDSLFPTCDPITCKKQTLENGTVEYCNGGSSMERVAYGTVATYKCNKGYTLNGTRTQTCGFNNTGKWNGTLPHCKLTKTGKPPTSTVSPTSTMSPISTVSQTSAVSQTTSGTDQTTCSTSPPNVAAQGVAPSVSAGIAVGGLIVGLVLGVLATALLVLVYNGCKNPRGDRITGTMYSNEDMASGNTESNNQSESSDSIKASDKEV